MLLSPFTNTACTIDLAYMSYHSSSSLLISSRAPGASADHLLPNPKLPCQAIEPERKLFPTPHKIIIPLISPLTVLFLPRSPS